MTTITINDARKAGICVAGLRSWCLANGLDIKELVRSGISSEFLIETGNQGLLDVMLAGREE